MEQYLSRKTESIVEKARQYVLEQTGNDILDWLYYEAGMNAENDVKARYAEWDEEHERFVDIDDVSVAWFTSDDWYDIEEMIFANADNYIDFCKEQQVDSVDVT